MTAQRGVAGLIKQYRASGPSADGRRGRGVSCPGHRPIAAPQAWEDAGRGSKDPGGVCVEGSWEGMWMEEEGWAPTQ